MAIKKARKTKAKLYDQAVNLKKYLNKSGHHSVATVEVRLPKGAVRDRFGHAFIQISDCGSRCHLVLGAQGASQAGISGQDNAFHKIDTLYKAIKRVRNEMKRRLGELKRPPSHLAVEVKRVAKKKKTVKKKKAKTN